MIMLASPVQGAAEAQYVAQTWGHALRKAMDTAHAASGGKNK